MSETDNQNRAITPHQNAITTLRTYLNQDGVKRSLSEVLPAYLKADRLVKIVIAAAQHNPTLLQCSKESLLLSVMEAGQLGLEAGSPIGHAYLVPFKNNRTQKYEATLIIGYKGLIELSRRSGQVASVEARVVHERDEFEVEYGLTQKLVHKPCLHGDAGQMKLAYCVIRLKDPNAEPIVEVMTKDEIDGLRKRSRASGSGPWVTDYEMMARKTVLRRAMHYAPMPGAMQEAMAREDARDRGEVIDVTALSDMAPPPAETPPVTKADELKAKLKAAKPAERVVEEPPLMPEPAEVDENGYDLNSDPEPEPKA